MGLKHPNVFFSINYYISYHYIISIIIIIIVVVVVVIVIIYIDIIIIIIIDQLLLKAAHLQTHGDQTGAYIENSASLLVQWTDDLVYCYSHSAHL